MYRLRPTEYEMKAYPITDYPARCQQAAAIMLMIMNNLDKRVAQFPHELVTYHILLHYVHIIFQLHEIWRKWISFAELGTISLSHEVSI